MQGTVALVLLAALPTRASGLEIASALCGTPVRTVPPEAIAALQALELELGGQPATLANLQKLPVARRREVLLACYASGELAWQAAPFASRPPGCGSGNWQEAF